MRSSICFWKKCKKKRFWGGLQKKIHTGDQVSCTHSQIISKVLSPNPKQLTTLVGPRCARKKMCTGWQLTSTTPEHQIFTKSLRNAIFNLLLEKMQKKAVLGWIAKKDPYRRPSVVHTLSNHLKSTFSEPQATDNFGRTPVCEEKNVHGLAADVYHT